jgi:hypothetical protein
MRSTEIGWTTRDRALLALCLIATGFSLAAYLDLGGNAGAAPGGPGARITSSDIARGTIRSSDVGDGRLRARDLGIYTVAGPTARVEGIPGPFNEAPAGARCNRRDRVLSGGHFNPGHDLHVKISHPDTDSHGWTIWVFNASQNPVDFRAYAICMRD